MARLYGHYFSFTFTKTPCIFFWHHQINHYSGTCFEIMLGIFISVLCQFPYLFFYNADIVVGRSILSINVFKAPTDFPAASSLESPLMLTPNIPAYSLICLGFRMENFAKAKETAAGFRHDNVVVGAKGAPVHVYHNYRQDLWLFCNSICPSHRSLYFIISTIISAFRFQLLIASLRG